MIRISTTDLDRFEAFKNGTRFFGRVLTIDDMVREIIVPRTSNRAMEIGTFVHKQLETFTDFSDSTNVLGYWNKPWSDVVTQLKEIYDSAHVQKEIKKELVIDGNYRLIGQADVCSDVAGYVADYKTTKSKVDTSRYESSWQWVAYCVIFGAKEFRYHIIKYRDLKRGIECDGLENITIDFDESYQNELIDLVKEYGEWIESVPKIDYYLRLKDELRQL